MTVEHMLKTAAGDAKLELHADHILLKFPEFAPDDYLVVFSAAQAWRDTHAAGYPIYVPLWVTIGAA